MDSRARERLAARVPEGAEAVLDVGCCLGPAAAALRQRGVRHLVGIARAVEDDAEGSRLYDRVLTPPLEEVAEEYSKQFDAILFGDRLEYFVDPSSALVRVRPWLSPRGVVVASVRNLGHWSVIVDLLEGRLRYRPDVPAATPLRLFTRQTLQDLFEASGYRIETVETVRFPASPEGAARLASLRSFPGASEDLEAAEFLVVARQSGEPTAESR